MQIDSQKFDSQTIHPVQSYAWGEFRESQGSVVERFSVGKKSYTVLFKTTPLFGRKIGILTQSHMIGTNVTKKLEELGRKHKAMLIKVEPYIYGDPSESKLIQDRKILTDLGFVSGKKLYPEYSTIIDLSLSEEELLAGMTSKTRYNTRLAARKGVKVVIDQEDSSFEQYLMLLNETTNRQQFLAHTNSYQKNMWQVMKNPGKAYIARAIHEGETLSAWMLLLHNNQLYYPYGASTRRRRNLMASSAVAWEVMKFGKMKNCTSFELWGCLGPNPDKNHSWYGLTRFKLGFGGKLIEYVGAHDLILNKPLYLAYKLADGLRSTWMSLKKRG